MSTTQVPPLALGILVAAAGLAYILWGPNGGEKRRSQRRGNPMGLTNPGNSCYVNAVLQALSACSNLSLWLEKVKSYSSEADAIDLRSALLAVIQQINNESGSGDSTLTPTGILKALRAHGWVIQQDEQDSHELLNVLLTTLEEELHKSEKFFKSSGSLCDIISEPPPEEEEEIEDESVKKGHKRRSSGVFVRIGGFEELSLNSVQNQTSSSSCSATPFTGTLTNKLIYTVPPPSSSTSSSKPPVSSNSFNSITLNLPSKFIVGVSLQSLLDMFTAEESVENIIKQQSFGRLPECLCFHIQRTAFERGLPCKRTDPVQFPAVLDMSEYVYANKHFGVSSRETTPALEGLVKNNNLYYLKAVIEHLGAINSGHYVTFRRSSGLSSGGTKKARWFFTSDSHIEEVDLNRVLEANPYMLFYEKEI